MDNLKESRLFVLKLNYFAKWVSSRDKIYSLQFCLRNSFERVIFNKLFAFALGSKSLNVSSSSFSYNFPFFSWFKPILAPDKQEKYWISQRYSIRGVHPTTKLITVVHIPPRRQLSDRLAVKGSEFRNKISAVCNILLRQTANRRVKIETSFVSGCLNRDNQEKSS